MTPPAIRSLLTLALGLALAPPAGSLPSRPLGPVVRSFQTYGLEQGLACLSTMAILQSRDGLLWVATQEGVFRYDGDRFEDLGRAQGLPSGLVFDLAEDADGTIWAGTLKGLARRTGESWRTVELPGSPAGEAIEAVGVDAEGKLLAAAIGGVWRCPGATCERIFTVPADAFANSLALDRRSGDLWFGGSFGVVRFHDHELERYAGPAAGIDAAIRSLLVTRDGTVFLRTADGLGRLDPRRRRFAPVPGIPSAADSSKLFEDRAGVLWVPSDAGLTGLAGDRAERRERFGVEQGLPSSATATVFEDREGSLWVSLAYAGVARWLGRDRFTAWTPTTGLPDETVWAIARLADGTLAFGTQRGLALVSPAGDAIRTVGAAEGLPGEFVLALAAAPDGGLWVGTAEGGFAHVRADGRVTDLGPGAGLGRDTAIAALAPAPDGTLWVGTSEGLWLGRGDPRRLRLRRVPLPAGDGSPAERPPAEIVSDVLADRAGRVFVAGRYGLALRDGGSWRRLTRADGLLDDHLLSLAETPAGELWIAYRDGRGVSQLSWPEGRARLRHFGPREGLRHDQATFVRADAAGRVWVGTTRGLSVRVGERFASFGRPDGMISEDTCTNAFLAERDGRVWIGTPRGAIAARLGERDLAPPPAPGVRLFSAALGGEPLDLGRAAIAPYSRRLFEARFAPLTFRHEGEVEMRSELVGLPGSAVVGRERRARFPMLAPGRYAFVASARIPGGAWSAPASYPFEIRPPWWGTTAARAVGLLSLVFAGVMGLFGGMLPAARAARINILEALRG
jgi:ligand-binding sensor domain-containing protein